MLTRRDIDAYSTPRPDFFSVPKLPHCAKFASSVARHACGVPSRGRLRNADRIPTATQDPATDPMKVWRGFPLHGQRPGKKSRALALIVRPQPQMEWISQDGLYFAGGK